MVFLSSGRLRTIVTMRVFPTKLNNRIMEKVRNSVILTDKLTSVLQPAFCSTEDWLLKFAVMLIEAMISRLSLF